MGKKKLLSLCIPTNGVSEWVFPVLDSIYNNYYGNLDVFEVIITDNGDNIDFKQGIRKYVSKFPNLIYKETKAIQFQNQIEAFKLASGDYIKFVNHRMMLLPGALEHLIEFVKKNCKDKPIAYFSNGNIKDYNTDNFDDFVRGLSYWSSWSAGTGIWKTDFENIKTQEFSGLFPHIPLIFSNPYKQKYIIDNTILMKEIPCDETKKGNYDIFKAFLVEYMTIILELYNKQLISQKTFIEIKSATLRFALELRYKYVVKKEPSSYVISDFRESYAIFYSNESYNCILFRFYFKCLCLKLVHWK